jgi:hypothetical protein
LGGTGENQNDGPLHRGACPSVEHTSPSFKRISRRHVTQPFQMLVAAAKALRGIKVLAHANSMRPPFNDPPLGEIYDCADITVLP